MSTLQGSGGKSNTLDENEREFYGVLVDVLRTKHVSGIPEAEGTKRIATMRGFRHVDFRRAHKAVTSFTKKTFPGCGKQQRLRLYRLLAMTAYDMVAKERRDEATALHFARFKEDLLDKLRDSSHSEFIDQVEEMVKAWPKKSKAPGLRGMLEALADVQTVVNVAFPGYSKSSQVVRDILKAAVNGELRPEDG